MKYIKRCTNVFLNKIVPFIFILVACSDSNNLKKHLEILTKKNNRIDINEWTIVQKIEIDERLYYSLKKEKGDTTFSLGFTYFETDDSYYIDDFIKKYYSDSTYIEMALWNNDTLYCFTYDAQRCRMGKPMLFKKMNFVTGKYYYSYKRGKLSWEQRKYFDANRDSLIFIKGNNLPELPEMKQEENDTIPITFENRNPR